MNLNRLYFIKEKMEEYDRIDDPFYQEICEKIEKLESILEDGVSATGGPSVGGMGAVVNAQPSSLAGATIGTSWASHGGTEGSGDVSFPYNAASRNNVFQKAEMGKDHGPRTGKKSRKKKINLKSLRDTFSKRQDYTKSSKKSPRVMSFDDFVKKDFTTIKK